MSAQHRAVKKQRIQKVVLTDGAVCRGELIHGSTRRIDRHHAVVVNESVQSSPLCTRYRPLDHAQVTYVARQLTLDVTSTWSTRPE